MHTELLNWTSTLEIYRIEMLYVILGLSAVTLFLKFKRDREGGNLDNPLHTINWIVMLVNALIQILYLVTMRDEAIWFCKPAQVGWLWTIIGFLLFSSVVYIQIKAFMETLEDFNYNYGGEVNWKLGLYSWPAAAVLYFVAIYLLPYLVYVVFIALLVVQTIQIIRIFKELTYYDGWGYALLVTIFYLILSATTLWILVHFTPLLIVALLAGGALYLFGSTSNNTNNSPKSGSKIAPKRCSTCGSNPDYCSCAIEFKRELNRREEG